jgi:hypothetical protein
VLCCCDHNGGHVRIKRTSPRKEEVVVVADTATTLAIKSNKAVVVTPNRLIIVATKNNQTRNILVCMANQSTTLRSWSLKKKSDAIVVVQPVSSGHLPPIGQAYVFFCTILRSDQQKAIL